MHPHASAFFKLNLRVFPATRSATNVSCLDTWSTRRRMDAETEEYDWPPALKMAFFVGISKVSLSRMVRNSVAFLGSGLLLKCNLRLLTPSPSLRTTARSARGEPTEGATKARTPCRAAKRDARFATPQKKQSPSHSPATNRVTSSLAAAFPPAPLPARLPWCL